MADRGVTRTLGALALTGLLLVACSGKDGSAAPTSIVDGEDTSTATELIDTRWTLETIADPQGVVEPVPGGRRSSPGSTWCR